MLSNIRSFLDWLFSHGAENQLALSGDLR